MKFSFEESVKILTKTPKVIKDLTKDLDGELIYSNEGKGTWSVIEITEHLIKCEREDWIPRLEIILAAYGEKRFQPFFPSTTNLNPRSLSLIHSLKKFKYLRNKNLSTLKSKNISTGDLMKKGIHPEFGNVTLKQLISAWTVHDLNHISQICRVISFQMKSDAGPWKAYLRIIRE